MFKNKKVKKFLASAATAAFLAGSLIPTAASAAGFSDVPVKHTHAEAINALTEQGMINGLPDGTFGLEKSITRGQVAKIFARYLAGEGKVEQVFTDLPANHSDQELVKAASEMKAAGVFTGSNGKFNAASNLTRQQMAKVIVETFDLEAVEGKESIVKDLDKASPDSRKYIQILSQHEVTTVEEFRPTEPVSRGQFATFMYRALSKTFTKCPSYGEIKPNTNPSFQHMNCLLTNAAIEKGIPPEVVKAVAAQESGGWKQFNENGEPVISADGGIGLMQITNQSNYDQQKLKYDIYYNIKAGVDILSKMYNRGDLPKIEGAGQQVIENWYFPVMAYNGIKPVNSPLVQKTGEKNKNAYQEQVFTHIENDSFLNKNLELNGPKLGQFPFHTADFEYDPNSSENIVFRKMEYTLTDETHTSAYFFKTGDKVVVTDDVNLRAQPSTSSASSKLAKNTVLIIQGNVVYDQNLNSQNQFVWYRVSTADQKTAGYISSAYIKEDVQKDREK
ncbi:S-layer homology domain-containing protein [Priestia abyssalis]|uniref:S-layer homology domain-containing protein n=1 Tax=Priestia abyssalis TaxID=1221450 RepID=UPI000994C013|nr:S-layer homology domain-containing protein [Priestia abyssalis]